MQLDNAYYDVVSYIGECDDLGVALSLKGVLEGRIDRLKDEAKASLAERFKAQRDELTQQFLSEAESQGLTMDDVFRDSTPATQRTRVPREPMYQNPDNPAQTWSGMGKRPAWINEQLDKGRTLDSLRIVPNAVTAVDRIDSIPF